MDNGPFNFEQIFVEFEKEGLVGSWKTGRFVRFGGSTGGLNGLMPVRPQNGSLRRTEPESWPVGGSTGRTGRSGPVFKTLLKTPKKLINFCILDIDIKTMSDTITKELCGHSFQLGISIECRSLMPKYNILSLILFHTILNKKGHLNELTLYVLYILFHMARCFKLNLSALICHNMIEAQCSNVNTCVTIWFNYLLVFTKCKVGFQVTALWIHVAHATYVHETVNAQTNGNLFFT